MKTKILFIGNCQMTTMCFYFQQLCCTSKYEIKFAPFNDDVVKHLNEWSDKCKNKITNKDDIINEIKTSDVVIYQEIYEGISDISNEKYLRINVKPTCKLIKLQALNFYYDNYDESLQKLELKENTKKVDIKISDIIKQFPERNLFINNCHPNTFLFLKIIEKICLFLNIPFFNTKQLIMYLKNKNYMGLPN